MIELLPIVLGVVCGLTLRRIGFGDVQLLGVTLCLGAMCSFVAEEPMKSWTYILIDWVTVYTSYVVVRLIVSGAARFHHSRKARQARSYNSKMLLKRFCLSLGVSPRAERNALADSGGPQSLLGDQH
jgi:hypothetical protein